MTLKKARVLNFQDEFHVKLDALEQQYRGNAEYIIGVSFLYNSEYKQHT